MFYASLILDRLPFQASKAFNSNNCSRKATKQSRDREVFQFTSSSVLSVKRQLVQLTTRSIDLTDTEVYKVVQFSFQLSPVDVIVLLKLLLKVLNADSYSHLKWYKITNVAIR